MISNTTLNNINNALLNSTHYNVNVLKKELREALARVTIYDDLEKTAPVGMKSYTVWYLLYTALGDMLIYPLRLVATEEDFKLVGQPGTLRRLLRVFEAESLLSDQNFSCAGDVYECFGLEIVEMFDDQAQTYTSQMTPEQIVELQKNLLLETTERDSVEDLIQDLYDNYLEPLKEMWTDDPRENHIAWESVHADFWY